MVPRTREEVGKSLDDLNLPPALVEGFQKLVSGDFSYRLPRSFKRDQQDTVAFFSTPSQKNWIGLYVHPRRMSNA